MLTQPPFIFRAVVLALCAMVAFMTMQGAYELTGTALLAVILGSCVAIQWMAARWAVEHLMAAAMQPGRRRAHAGMGVLGLVLWFLPAVVTVSLVAGELSLLMTAREVGATRFEAEQRRVQARANAVVANLDAVQSGLAALAVHAAAMAKKEEATGSSCMASTGKGRGPVREFRDADNNFASSLNGQMATPLRELKAELAAVGQMRFDTADVGALRADLQLKATRLNAMPDNAMLASLREAAAKRLKDAENIDYYGSLFHCDDATRTALLQQVINAVDGLHKLPPLENIVLMDPRNGRAIATASLLRTWHAISGVFPAKLQVPLNAELARQFDIGQGRLELTPSNLGGFLAWILELMLIAALVMGTNVPQASGLGPVGRLLLRKVGERVPFIGELGEAAFAPSGTAEGHSRPYVDTQIIFPDGSLEDRVAAVLKHYRPYGPVDLLVVPLQDRAAMKAVRELELLRLVARKASALSRDELVRDPRFGAVIAAMAPYEPGPFAVFRIDSADLARHVLTRDERGAATV